MTRHNPPGPHGLTFLRTVSSGKTDRLTIFSELVAHYGDLVHFLLIPTVHGYILNHPDYVRYVLVDHPELFHKGPGLKRATKRSIGNGLLTSEDDFHKRQRKLVQPAFHAQRITAYGEIMVDYATKATERWQDSETYDISKEMMKLTLDIITRTMFNADVSSDAEHIGEAITVGIEAVASRITQPLRLPLWVPTSENRRQLKASDFIDTMIMRIINERRASGEDRGDLLSMLLLAVDEDNGGQMNDKQIHDEAITLFVAGHETTANALSWTWYLLAKHPNVENKLHAELDTVLQNRRPNIAEQAKLTYTEKVIKESMRLYPPAWLMARRAQQAFMLDSYTIPKGSLLFFSPYLMQRHARYFDEPEHFNPDRWTEEFEKMLPKYAYFPFGGGPRVCIGQAFAIMEARLILATIAQRYSLSLESDEPIGPDALITLRTKEKLMMHVSDRVAQPAPVTS
jgi:cytochrome P450